jgi:hypothetical protein
VEAGDNKGVAGRRRLEGKERNPVVRLANDLELRTDFAPADGAEIAVCPDPADGLSLSRTREPTSLGSAGLR